MRIRSRLGVVLATGLMAGLLLCWRLFDQGESPKGATPTAHSPTTLAIEKRPARGGDQVDQHAQPDEAARQQPKMDSLQETSPPERGLKRELDSLLAMLGNRAPREEVRSRLQALKTLIHGLPPDSAASAIIAFLQSGLDAPTGLGFVVGGEGVLDEAPTLRVALLDWLAQTDPSQALDYSRALLPLTSHSDEYAIALRNLAWLNPNGALDMEIAAAFAQMLDRGDWLAKPTAGFLEAFDAAVAIGGRDSWLQLGSVLRMETTTGDSPEHPANRAAFIALDRLMLREPETLVALLRDQPDWLSWAPLHRASLLTRLDVRSESQRAFLRGYLLSGAHFPGELEYFSSVFPNVNRFSGNRLVTEWEGMQATPDLDQATLDQVRHWTTDPAFSGLIPHLQTILQRIELFYPR